MDLVFLYGPPAAGKLTIATQLAKDTGYKLFHNQLSIAAIEPVFEFGTDTFWRLVLGMRADVIEAAAQNGIDLIFTSVYEHPDDLPWVSGLFARVESAAGRVCLVQLSASIDEIERRMPSPERRALGKLVDPDVFRTIRESQDVFSPIPDRASLAIDTGTTSPQAASMRIIRHYMLPEASAT